MNVNMEKHSTLYTSEKMIAILGDRRWPQKAKQEGDKVSSRLYAVYGKTVMSAQGWRVY